MGKFIGLAVEPEKTAEKEVTKKTAKKAPAKKQETEAEEA